MDARKRKAIVYGLFVLAFLWGAYNFAGNEQKRAEPAPSPAKQIEAAEVKPPAKSIDVEKYSMLEWGKDPFHRGRRTPVEKPPAEIRPRWTLGGILYDENTPSAVINKKIVRNGDNIDGARVMQIDRQKVTLEKNGLQFTLTVEKDKS